MFTAVRRDVLKATLQRQQPELLNALTQPLYLKRSSPRPWTCPGALLPTARSRPGQGVVAGEADFELLVPVAPLVLAWMKVSPPRCTTRSWPAAVKATSAPMKVKAWSPPPRDGIDGGQIDTVAAGHAAPRSR